MKLLSWLRRVPLALIILLVGILGFLALLNLKPAPEPTPEPDPPKPVVQVEHIELQTRALTVETQGSVQPRRSIQLVSQVGGQILEVAPEFVTGGSFSKGDWLVRVDRRDYQFALAGAESRLREAQRMLAEERGRSRQAEREWRDLGNEDANALFLRKPQLAAAEAAVEAARAERDQAQLEMERAEVQAPFSGRISETLVDLGQNVAPTTQIAQIYDDSLARIRLPLTDAQAALLDLPMAGDLAAKEGPKVTFSGRVSGERYQWQGQIKRTEASLDAQSRMAYAVAEVERPFDRERHPAPMLMGLFVDAEIEGRVLENVASLPSSAVFRRDRIYTLTEDRRVQEKQVRVLRSDGDRVWVRGELADGEAVIIDRLGYVSPGVAVRIQGEQNEDESASDAEGDDDQPPAAEGSVSPAAEGSVSPAAEGSS